MNDSGTLCLSTIAKQFVTPGLAGLKNGELLTTRRPSKSGQVAAAEFPLELHEGRSDGADIALLRSRPAQRPAKEVSSYNIHLTVLKYL